jgi:hypothetical protein
MIEDEQEPAPTKEENEELERLASLLTTSAHFELSPSALARGRAEIDELLSRQASKQREHRVRVWLLWPLPAGLVAALLVALVVRSKAGPPPPLGPELATAQSHFLTAELTGAPVPRKDLDRATRQYRKDLLASLGAKR